MKKKIQGITLNDWLLLLNDFFDFFEKNYYILDNRFLALTTNDKKIIDLVYSYSSLKVYISDFNLNNRSKESESW